MAPVKIKSDMRRVTDSFPIGLKRGKMNEVDTMKPCPHCGGDAYLQANYSYKTRCYFVMCKCDFCGAQGKIFSSKVDPESVGWNNEACNSAIKAWNMRFNEQRE